jgi:hypothetical protein
MLDVSTECAASISHTEFSSRSKNRRGFGMCVKKKKNRKELCQETVFHALPCTQPASCPSLLRSIGWLRCRLLFIDINFSICLRSRNLHAFLFFLPFSFSPVRTSIGFSIPHPDLCENVGGALRYSGTFDVNDVNVEPTKRQNVSRSTG